MKEIRLRLGQGLEEQSNRCSILSVLLGDAPEDKGIQLSWESTCFASRGSAVRSRLSPPNLFKTNLFSSSRINIRVVASKSVLKQISFTKGLRKQEPERNMGLQLRWLERTPDKREVGGSSPLKPTRFEEGKPSTDRPSPARERRARECTLKTEYR